MNHLRSRLQTLIRGENGRVATRISSTSRRSRKPSFVTPPTSHGRQGLRPEARFGLVGIATLPFASWLALFTYEYYYRVHLCRRSITQSLNQANYSSQPTFTPDKSLIGQYAQWQEAQSLLAKEPRQIIIISGPRQCGKSLFATSLFEQIHKTNNKQRQGVTFLPLSDPKVDSWSTIITRSFVKAFDLRWLHLRHALVDAFPFLGSNVFVMNETFHGDERDLIQALAVITQALEEHTATANPSSPRPVIIIDGLGGEDSTRSRAGVRCTQHVLDWCVYIATERNLAHVVLTANDDWVIRWTEHQSQINQEKIHIIGLSTLGASEVGPIVLQEWPDAVPFEIEKLTDSLGGSVPDVLASCRAIQQRLDSIQKEDGDSCSKARRTQIINQILSVRFRYHMERVIAALFRGKGTTTQSDENMRVEGGDENESYVDALTHVESGVGEDSFQGSYPKGGWSQLQLWRTINRLVEAHEKYGNMGVPFADLRDNIFGGNTTPLQELMKDGLLRFDIRSYGDASPDDSPDQSWQITPGSSLLCRVFTVLVQNSHMKKYFQNMECLEERRAQLLVNERENRQLRLERRRLDMRKVSLLQTAELGTVLDMDRESLSLSMKEAYDNIVADEIVMERRYQDLRAKREAIHQDSRRLETKEALAPSGQLDTNQAFLHDHLRKAIQETCVQEEERVLRFQISSEKTADSSAKGLTASDLIRRIKEQTGDEMDAETAESFIRAWDSNKDTHTHTHLDYDELIEMLVADATMQRKKTLKKKRKAVVEGVKKKSTVNHPAEQGDED